ncbi:ATP-dependent DNA helicase [Trichonephila clavata]|uniref:ATP-dependent DNA helicase n=1 Tax=Trichonephila clavata TaxID=2740835 RepID=A0A8X6L321_TRICU|nr:ATP-dependent DNA helicase [Trichonephila clavata]
MAAFLIENTNVNAPLVNNNNEITLYQIRRYISSNEAVGRIFGFEIHERDPAVINLAVHLVNSQCVFFTNEIAVDRATKSTKNYTPRIF